MLPIVKNIFFIPLRSSSKGIPGKNYKNFYGKPLFCWCLDTVINTNLADEIWVATDCSIIKSLVKEKYHSNIVKVFQRNAENAQDASPTIDVVTEFLTSGSFSAESNFILIQATSPLTSAEDIKTLIQNIDRDEKDSFIACARLKCFRWTDDGKSLDYRMDKPPRRQDYKGFLVQTGAFYASKIGLILETGHLISGKIGIIELGKESLIDIDEPVDWKIGEAYLEYILNKQDE